MIACNIPPGSYLSDFILDDMHYSYKSSSGVFCVTDRSGNNIKSVLSSFEHYKKDNLVKPADTILYRTFWKNPHAFLRWHIYINK